MTNCLFNLESTAPVELAIVRPLLALGLLMSTALAGAVPAAFVQPDPVTKELPFSAFTVMREGRNVPSNSELRPCDKLSFNSSQNKFDKIILTSTRGGKSLILRADQPVTLSCTQVPLKEKAADVWKIIAGGDRVATVSAATRGTDFALPIFASDRSNIAAGKRALYVSWTGGRPPFRLLITSGKSVDVLVDVKGITENQVRLPELDLKPGQYSLAVSNSPGLGEPEAMQEDNLFVVPQSELPPMPTALANAQLGKVDTELLYCFYLEGLAAGRWSFEAMQHAASVMDLSSAAREWLQEYGKARAR